MARALDLLCTHALSPCFNRLGFVPTLEEPSAVHAAILARTAVLLRGQG